MEMHRRVQHFTSNGAHSEVTSSICCRTFLNITSYQLSISLCNHVVGIMCFSLCSYLFFILSLPYSTYFIFPLLPSVLLSYISLPPHITYFPLVLPCLGLPMFICPPPYIEFVFLSFSFLFLLVYFICLYITNLLCPITVKCDLFNHHFPPLFTFFLRLLFSDLCHSHSGQTDHSSCHNHHCRH